MNTPCPESLNYRKAIIVLFSIGLALQVMLSLSYWVGRDQIHLLNLGMKLVDNGELSGFSKIKSTGGTNLGSLMQMLVAAPLFFYKNFRSPMIIPIIFSVLSYFLVLPIIRDNFKDKGVFIFTIIFWLSPTRLFNTGFLWEPAYIFLPAALHLYSAYNMKDEKSFLYSFLHIFSLFVALQIHNSVLILFLISVYLLINKKIKVDIKGILIGSFIGLLFFIPLLTDIINNNLPEPTASSGYLGKGLVQVLPLLKGFLYFVKLSAFDMVRALKETIFWEGPYKWIMMLFQLLSILAVIIGIYANYKYYRANILIRWKSDYNTFTSGQLWLKSYGVGTFWGILISSALSPITLQGWMVVIALLPASIPMLYLINKLDLQKLKPRLFIYSYLLVEIAIVFILFFGQSKFNRHDQYPVNIDEPRNKNIKVLFNKI